MEASTDLCELTLHSASSSAYAEPPGLFLCVYCGRKFYNSQAFGGHQNAHKEERRVARHRLEIATARRAHAAVLSSSSSGPSPKDAARAIVFFPSAKKVSMETLEERGRSFPDHGAASRTGDGLDLSLRL